jgi:hypothetical protein
VGHLEKFQVTGDKLRVWARLTIRLTNSRFELLNSTVHCLEIDVSNSRTGQSNGKKPGLFSPLYLNDLKRVLEAEAKLLLEVRLED